MQKTLFCLCFICLSANVWAQKSVPTNVEMAQMVLDFYTEPNFLDTLKATEKSKKDTAFFFVSNNQYNLGKGTKLLFTFDKKNKKLTHNYVDLDSIKHTWASGYNTGYDSFILEIDNENRIDIVRNIIVAFEDVRKLIEIPERCCGGVQTCKTKDGRIGTITGICHPRIKIEYSKDSQKYILRDDKYIECDHTKEEYRTYFARQYLK